MTVHPIRASIVLEAEGVRQGCRSRRSAFQRLVAGAFLLAAFGVFVSGGVGGLPAAFTVTGSRHWRSTRVWRFLYPAHDGALRLALLALPAWYGPRDHPLLPLGISPAAPGVPPQAHSAPWR